MQSDARPLTRRVDYKIHGLTDACCRPIAFLLTGGQVADCIAADELLDGLITAEILHGDKGYDSNASVERSRARAWSQHPTQKRSTLEELLLAVALSALQCDRAHVRTPQGLSSHRNPRRPTRT
jgi:transposase